MSAIVPTYTCFDDALDFFEQVIAIERIAHVADDFRIVHGVCTGADTGEPYAHAWVEQRNCAKYYDGEGVPVPPVLVWQAGTIEAQRVYFALPRDAFLADYGVTHFTAYSLRTACELNFHTGHYGPWHAEYADLVRRVGEGRIVGVVTSAKPSIVIGVHATGISIYRMEASP